MPIPYDDDFNLLNNPRQLREIRDQIKNQDKGMTELLDAISGNKYKRRRARNRLTD